VTGSVDQAAKRLNTRHIRVGLWQELGLEYPIESSQLGDAVDDFLRDRPCRQPELWSEVAAVIELALAATATKTDDFLRQGDRSNRDAFAVKLQNRLAQGPRRPPGSLRRLARALRTRGLKRTLRAAMRLLPVTKSVPKT
jgi:hypothetical protein